MAITIDIEVQLNVTATKGLDPARLTLIRKAAEDAVEQYCERTFSTTTHAEKQDGAGETSLFVRQLPIQSLDSDAVIVTDCLGNSITYANTVVNFDAETGEIQFKCDSGGWFTQGFQNILITYDAGFSDDDMPRTIKQAVYELVGLFLASNNDANPLMSGEKLGDYSYTRQNVNKIILAGPWPGHITSLLAPHAGLHI